jgi:nucleoside-diphosphate-sugar epimerase
MTPPWNAVPSPSWDTSTWIANPAAIGEDLGWTARYSFERAFSRFLDWFTAYPGVLEAYRRIHPLRSS